MALSEAQLQERIGLVTSSVVPVIVKQEQFKRSVWTVQQVIKGLYREVPSEELNKLFRRGDSFEPNCLTEGANDTACFWDKAPFKRHENGWSGDSTDALYFDRVSGELLFVAESKTVMGMAMHDWGDPGTDEVPEHVRLQCYWHLYHWPEVESCVVPVLFGTDEKFQFDTYFVFRDNNKIQETVEICHRFHRDYIVGDGILEPTGKDDDAIRGMYPREHLPEREPDPDLVRLVHERIAIDKKLGLMKDHQADLTAQIRVRMGDYASCKGDGWSISNKSPAPKTVFDDKKLIKLAKELGATEEMIITCAEVVQGSRRLTVSPIKPKAPKKDKVA